MKINKKILSVLVAGIIMISNVGTVFAVENSIGLSPKPPKINEGNISVYGLQPPDISVIYPNNTQSTVAGNSTGYPLYTEKCFYGAKEITYSVVNEASGKLSVELYCYNTVTKKFLYAFSSQNIEGNSKGAGSFKNLDPQKYYCLKFDGGNMDFHGFVGGKTN